MGVGVHIDIKRVRVGVGEAVRVFLSSAPTPTHPEDLGAKQTEAGLLKLSKHALYERFDEQLQQLVSNFHL